MKSKKLIILLAIMIAAGAAHAQGKPVPPQELVD